MSFGAGDVMFREADVGDCFNVSAEGTVEVLRSASVRVVKLLLSNQVFAKNNLACMLSSRLRDVICRLAQAL